MLCCRAAVGIADRDEGAGIPLEPLRAGVGAGQRQELVEQATTRQTVAQSLLDPPAP